MAVTERRAVSARRDSLLGDEPGAFAVARFARITPMKARRVVDLVRGMPVNDALATLRFAPQAASETVYKVLASAVSNAESTEDLSADQLVVTKAFVDEGPTMKRHRPRAQGRATRINKRTSHITLVVAPETADERPAKKATAKQAAAKSAEKATAKKTPAKKAAAKKTADEPAAKKTTAKTTAKKSTAKKSATSTDEKEA